MNLFDRLIPIKRDTIPAICFGKFQMMPRFSLLSLLVCVGLASCLAPDNSNVQIIQDPSSQANCNTPGSSDVVACTTRTHFQFSQQVGDEILAQLPDKRKKVLLYTGGNESDQKVGSDVQGFLIQNGYKVDRRQTRYLLPPPDHAVTVNADDDQYTLTVAPSAH